MRHQRLLQYIDIFYKLATDSEKLPENSDDIDTVLKNLSKLETFKARIDYAEKNLDHLSSGSARVIYTFDNKKEVLKLAKNDRGVAQNKAESKVKCKYVIETTKSDPNGVWKISPYAEKITEKEFEKYAGFPFEDFGQALEYGLRSVSDNTEKKPKDFDKISKTEMYKNLVECGKKHDLLPGDLSRISSWGKMGDKPIVLDAGLTSEIYDEFYNTAEKSS